MLGVDCCKDCVPPKRQLGCHDRCEEYQKAKKEYEKAKEEYEKSKNPVIAKYSFLGDYGQKRRNTRKRGKSRRRK